MLVGHRPCRQPRCPRQPTPAYTCVRSFWTPILLHFLVTVVQKLYICSLWGLIFDDSCTKTLHLSSHGPKWGQDAPRWSQDTPRWSQDAPKWSPDGPKMEPRCSNLLLFGAYLSSHCTLLVCACLGLCALCVSCVFSHFDAPLTHILIVRVYAETC